MKDTKAVNTIVRYVENRLERGVHYTEILNELSHREEVRAGYLSDVVDLLTNDIESFYKLYDFLNK